MLNGICMIAHFTKLRVSFFIHSTWSPAQIEVAYVFFVASYYVLSYLHLQRTQRVWLSWHNMPVSPSAHLRDRSENINGVGCEEFFLGGGADFIICQRGALRFCKSSEGALRLCQTLIIKKTEIVQIRLEHKWCFKKMNVHLCRRVGCTHILQILRGKHPDSANPKRGGGTQIVPVKIKNPLPSPQY